jgi:hypothetical protein
MGDIISLADRRLQERIRNLHPDRRETLRVAQEELSGPDGGGAVAGNGGLGILMSIRLCRPLALGRRGADNRRQDLE